MTAAVAIRFANVVKAYGGLRPLRVKHLAVTEGERVSLAGVDAIAAEALVNLVTGASLPDEGRVDVRGTNTADIQDGDAWLASLDQFGIVSERAVMLEGASFLQNLALPLSLEIDAIAPDVRRRIEALASEAGLRLDRLDATLGAGSPLERTQAQIARAIALDPRILLLEHPSAALPRDVAGRFGAGVAAIVTARGITALAITEDAEFAEGFASRRLMLKGATGEVVPARAPWKLFG